MTTPKKSKKWLTGPQVRERYGDRSEVWLWRKDTTDPLFPKPMWLDGKKHYREDELDAYDEQKRQNPDAPLICGKRAKIQEKEADNEPAAA